MTGPLKVTTLRSYMKDRTGFRVEKAAVEALAAHKNAQIAKVVDRAGALVELQGQRTVQLADVTRALADVAQDSAKMQPPGRLRRCFRSLMATASSSFRPLPNRSKRASRTRSRAHG